MNVKGTFHRKKWNERSGRSRRNNEAKTLWTFVIFVSHKIVKRSTKSPLFRLGRKLVKLSLNVSSFVSYAEEQLLDHHQSWHNSWGFYLQLGWDRISYILYRYSLDNQATWSFWQIQFPMDLACKKSSNSPQLTNIIFLENPYDSETRVRICRVLNKIRECLRERRIKIYWNLHLRYSSFERYHLRWQADKKAILSITRPIYASII